jgi:hypothetical protein
MNDQFSLEFLLDVDGFFICDVSMVEIFDLHDEGEIYCWYT